MYYTKTGSHFMKKLNSVWTGYLLIILLGLFSSGQVLAAVSVTGSTQSPPNDVIAGNNVSYSFTLDATANHFVSVQIFDNGQLLSGAIFSADTPGCSFDGATVFCGQQTVGTKTYNFSWIQPPTEGTHNLSFVVDCGFQCTGVNVPFTTIVRALQPGTLQFSNTGYQAAEGTTATITVTRTGGSDGTLVADVVIGGGSSDTASSADYTAPANTTVTFAPNVISQTIDIPVLADALVEGNETLSLALVGVTGVVGTPAAAVLTIVDNTPQPQTGDLQFSSATYQATEGTTATITVTRTGGSAGTQAAQIIIGGGTADTATTNDYTPPASTVLTFADGVTTQSIDIQINTDTLVEGNEVLSLTLQPPLGDDRSVRAIGTPSTALLTIIDANTPGTLGFSGASFTVSEQNGEAVITVVRSGSPDGSLSAVVEITGDTATQDEDFQLPGNLALTWAPGDVSPKEIRIPILADNMVEADETVNLLLKDNQGQSISAATLTITDTPPVADQVDVVSGSQQNGTSGTTLAPFAIRVLDSAGNPIIGAPVTWTVSPSGAGTLSEGTQTTSGSDGATSNTLTLNSNGRVVVTARAAQGENQTATFVVNRALIDTPQLTVNQRRVAVALDSACAALTAKQASGVGLTAAEADLLATCNKLAAASDADITEGLSRLAPDEVSSQGTATIKIANLQVTNVNSRLNALRSGERGMSLSGLNLNIQGKAIPNEVLNAMLDGQARGGSAGDETGGHSPWGGFINGEISFGDKDDTDREPGFDFDTTGITAGIDYRVSDEVVVGGAVGYGSTEADFNDGVSKMELEGWHLTGYGTYYRADNFYIDGLAKLGWNTYDTSRRVNFPGDPLQKAEGDTDSLEYSFSITGGYEYNKDALTLGGYGRLSYTKVEIDGYSETASNPGVPGFGSVLKLADQDVDSLTTTLGGQVSYAISTSKAVFMPQLRLEWEHEFNNGERAIDAQFIYDPSSTTFGVLTDEPDKDYFNVGLGFSVVTTGGKSGFLYYETRIDQDNIEQHWVKGGLRFEY
ncbi:MAG TPA: autotransporter domain-containing protein [Chromatiales bacterium]|nr:autotransporter domain-containing protein [Thiotrichales bacterium]HIP67641.1 autotransporter domain-containing protein [Chromatiales bacterium]